MPVCVEFLHVIVSRPSSANTAQEIGARIKRAADVQFGDLVLAAFTDATEGTPESDAARFEPYAADPHPFDPRCGCGVCAEVDPAQGPYVVLVDDYPSGPTPTCDVWSAEAFVLVVPA